MSVRDVDLIRMLKKLAAKATPGPWAAGFNGVMQCLPGEGPVVYVAPFCEEDRAPRDADAEFIAACSPEVVTALADAYEETLRKLLLQTENLRDAIRRCVEVYELLPDSEERTAVLAAARKGLATVSADIAAFRERIT